LIFFDLLIDSSRCFTSALSSSHCSSAKVKRILLV